VRELERLAAAEKERGASGPVSASTRERKRGEEESKTQDGLGDDNFFFPVLSLIDLLNPLLSTPTKKMTSPPSNPTSPPGDEPEPKLAPIDAKPAGGQAETNPDDRTVRAYVFSSSSNRD
jgi:hypothetical protein